MPPAKLVVFDLDGTLVDTAPDLAATMNMVLAREGYAQLDPEAVRLMVGHGARALMERGLGAAGVPLSDSLLDRLVYDFLQIYQEHIADGSRPFPGAVAALDRLEAAGSKVAVCTNKPAKLSEQLLAELGLRDRFAAVVGGDSLDSRKPHPAPLIEAIRLSGSSNERSVMIGDSVTDVETARAAGVPVVGVTFGYTNTPMAELGPDALIDHFDELDAALAAVGR